MARERNSSVKGKLSIATLSRWAIALRTWLRKLAGNTCNSDWVTPASPKIKYQLLIESACKQSASRSNTSTSASKPPLPNNSTPA